MTVLPPGKNSADSSGKTPNKVWQAGTLTYTTIGLAVLFCWLLSGDFAWSMKERSVPFVLQLMLKKFDASDTIVGLFISSTPGIMAILLGPIISYKSDRHRGPWGRRIPFLFITAPVVTLSMVGLAFSPEIGKYLHQTLGLYSPGLNSSVIVFFGLFWTVFEFTTITANAIFGALVNDVVPQPLLGRFYAAFRALSLIAGMIFGHWLYGKTEAHYVWFFLGIGVLYGFGLTVMCLKVKEGEYPPPPPAGPNRGVSGFLHAAIGYFKECFGIPYYWWYFGAYSMSWVAFVPINTFSISFSKSIQMDQNSYGNYIALTYLASLVLAYPMGWLADKFHPLRVGLIMQGLYVAATLWGGLFATNSSNFSIALVAHGVLSGAWFTATASIGQRLLPKNQFAQFSSAAGIIYSFGMIMIGPVVGRFLDYTHHIYRYTYLISCGMEVLAMYFGLVLYSKFMALGGPKNYVAPE